ncbi:hypothetical protein LAZ67_1007145 [Cordylochernes scorpioides]|uniref:Uncharacterized protein n=1 Tax=Cordylochernes scorpioides TaxID=51811 RepID=A0ABY6JZ40_9ARAC|nr:hypothetical protein LAZ67_1007145 [Cordylochernes scorpioides]
MGATITIPKPEDKASSDYLRGTKEMLILFIESFGNYCKELVNVTSAPSSLLSTLCTLCNYNCGQEISSNHLASQGENKEWEERSAASIALALIPLKTNLKSKMRNSGPSSIQSRHFSTTPSCLWIRGC